MMLANNMVIQWESESENSKFERVLWIDSSKNYVVLFKLEPDIKDKNFPYIKELSSLEEAITLNLASKRSNDPYAKIVDENYLDKYGKDKEKAWKIIKDLVEDEPDIYDSKLRGKLVEEAVEKYSTTKKTIYKYLKKYWRYGKTPNALLPLFNNCGAPGKSREITDQMLKDAKSKGKTIPKRGRPPLAAKYHPELIGYNVTKNDKKNMEKAIVKHYENYKRKFLTEVYSDYLAEFHSVIIRDEKFLDPSKKYPSLHQFKDYFYSRPNLRKTLIKREGENGYNLRHRPVLDTSIQSKLMGPGYVYQMDSTIAGVHLVNRYDRTKLILKPEVYLVMDVFSRFIVGFHIGLGHAWDDAKMALLDAFQNEMLDDEDVEMNQICYLPKVILTDRGPENIGVNSDKVIDSLGIRMATAASYRGDMKGIVEQEFNQLKQKIRHLPGFVKKGYKERGEKDHALEATLDIEDFIKAVKAIVDHHNYKSYMRNYTLDVNMVKDSLDPYPVNIWKWGIENRIGAFRQVSTELAIINLLPSKKATITEFGIRLEKQMYFTCEHAIKEQWFLRTGSKIGKKVELFYDVRNCNIAYLRLEGNYSFERCNLMPRSERYKNYRFEEAIGLITNEKVKLSVKLHEQNQVNIDLNKTLASIAKDSIQKTEEHMLNNNTSNTQRKKDRKDNRKVENELLRQSNSDALSEKIFKAFLERDGNPTFPEETNIEEDNFTPVYSKEKAYRDTLKGWKKMKGS
ncbi:transposase family protein [Peribacillus frigoritolerans]